MNNKKGIMLHSKKTYLVGIIAITTLYSCVPTIKSMEADKSVPEQFKNQTTDSLNTAQIKWKEYFTDPYLDSLIGIALENNQELNTS